ncbi:MAG TPA: hypothetical protein VNX68_04605 [Nitrosopumilaceae archaeon]|nr:hypothetical protein [Nitrosopumilaceae archaeon]
MEQYEKDYRWRMKCKKNRVKYIEFLKKLHGGSDEENGKKIKHDKRYLRKRVANPSGTSKLV